MTPRPNIHELARLSGVSVGTVSRALNGYADVSPQTRERIMRMAEELDYTPAAAARTPRHPALARGRRLPRDGRGPPRPAAPVLPRGARRAQAYARRRAATTCLLFASEQPGNGYGTHSYLKRCRHHNVDGACSWASTPRTPRCAGWCARTSPTVGVDVELEGPPTTSVVVRQRGRLRRGRAPPPRARPPPHRAHHRPARQAPGRRRACAATATSCSASGHLPRRVRRPTATSTSTAAARRWRKLLALDEPPTAVWSPPRT